MYYSKWCKFVHFLLTALILSQSTRYAQWGLPWWRTCLFSSRFRQITIRLLFVDDFAIYQCNPAQPFALHALKGPCWFCLGRWFESLSIFFFFGISTFFIAFMLLIHYFLHLIVFHNSFAEIENCFVYQILIPPHFSSTAHMAGRYAYIGIYLWLFVLFNGDCII